MDSFLANNEVSTKAGQLQSGFALTSCIGMRGMPGVIVISALNQLGQTQDLACGVCG